MTESVSEAHAMDPDSERYVQSLARGLQVLRAFDADHPEMTLSALAQRVGLSRATVRRLLGTLEHLGYVGQVSGRFGLTPRVLELGHSYLSALRLPDLAQPHLEELSRRTGRSASLSVLVDTEIAYVARVSTRRIMSIDIQVGTRFPAYATSMGRVLLADLAAADLDRVLAATARVARTATTTTDPARLRDEITRARVQGWALVDEELEEGLRSVAAPVRGRDGAVVAAVNVATFAVGSARGFVDDVLGPLHEAAGRVTEAVHLLPSAAVHGLGPARPADEVRA